MRLQVAHRIHQPRELVQMLRHEPTRWSKTVHIRPGMAPALHACMTMPIAPASNQAKPVLLVYATINGQTQRVAQAIFAQLIANGQPAKLLDISAGFNPHGTALLLQACPQVVLVSALRTGHYARVMQRFMRQHQERLRAIDTSFVSISLTQAAVQDLGRAESERRTAAEGLKVCLNDLLQSTGFEPKRVVQVAGTLAYTQYGPLVRWVMKRIARGYGASTDTSRDHELTDWEALHKWVEQNLLVTAPTVIAARPCALPQAVA